MSDTTNGNGDAEGYLTDNELKARWKCSHMKLHRLRARAQLPKPVRIGGTGPNLTPIEVVRKLEAESGPSLTPIEESCAVTARLLSTEAKVA